MSARPGRAALAHCYGMAMSLRGPIQRLRSVRVLWSSRQIQRGYAISTSNSTVQSWPHQSQFGNIHDDQVARLAAQPLHPLTLADLVRYAVSLDVPLWLELTSMQPWAPSASRRSSLRLRQFHPLTAPNPPRAPHPIAPQPSVHRRVEPAHCSDLQQLRPLSFHTPSVPRTTHKQP